jgi:anti-anti-sigma factor
LTVASNDPARIDRETTRRSENASIRDKIRNATVLEVAGRLTTGGAESVLRQAVDRALAEAPTSLFLDFARVSVMDTAGVGELAASYVKAKDVGCEMALIAPRSRIETLLTLCGLGDFFPVFDSKVDALESTRKWSTLVPNVLYPEIDGDPSSPVLN